MSHPDTDTDPTTNGQRPVPAPIDLDAELADILEDDPQPITLGGRTYRVRRDHSGADQLDYWRAVLTARDQDALRIMFADLADDDLAALERLMERYGPKRHQQLMHKLHKISRIPEVPPAALRVGQQPQPAGGDPRGNRPAS